MIDDGYPPTRSPPGTTPATGSVVTSPVRMTPSSTPDSGLPEVDASPPGGGSLDGPHRDPRQLAGVELRQIDHQSAGAFPGAASATG